jgi:low affinity Fe/Cu permease
MEYIWNMLIWSLDGKIFLFKYRNSAVHRIGVNIELVKLRIVLLQML